MSLQAVAAIIEALSQIHKEDPQEICGFDNISLLENLFTFLNRKIPEIELEIKALIVRGFVPTQPQLAIRIIDKHIHTLEEQFEALQMACIQAQQLIAKAEYANISATALSMLSELQQPISNDLQQCTGQPPSELSHL